MGKSALLGILSSFFLLAIAAPGCGDSEQEPTGATTPSGGSGATGGGGAGAAGGGGHAAHGGMGGAGGDTTGGGGAGGGPECVTTADCGEPTECAGWLCSGGECLEVAAPGNKPLAAQTPGDCKTATCGGFVAAAGDAFDDLNDCTADACDGESPTNEAEPMGTDCASNGGKFCDGAKKCVECLMDGDCQTGVCTQDNTCAPAECGDETQNGSETDVDCGGPVCGKCSTGKGCGGGGDCQSGVCHPVDKVCVAATCSDGVKNQNESDKDCGGVCGSSCTTGKSCGSPNDCVDLVCGGMPLTCQPPSCMDGVKNGMETDVNCGGPVCPDCGVGKLCSTGDDCTSGVCSGTPATCQTPTCTDSTKNGNETGLDCGGGMCPACPNDQGCNVNADCLSGFCTAQKLCKTPTCTDNVKNGTETDVDCGGTCPADCQNGLGCLTGADCQSGFCLGNPLTCQPLNGCTAASFVDMTGQSMVSISFGSFFYTPACLKVSPGTQVTWNGEFISHPLQGGTVLNFMGTPDNSQIPFTNTGTTKTVTFGSAGTFPYYCQFHVASMQGVVLVQ